VSGPAAGADDMIPPNPPTGTRRAGAVFGCLLNRAPACNPPLCKQPRDSSETRRPAAFSPARGGTQPPPLFPPSPPCPAPAPAARACPPGSSRPPARARAAGAGWPGAHRRKQRARRGAAAPRPPYAAPVPAWRPAAVSSRPSHGARRPAPGACPFWHLDTARPARAPGPLRRTGAHGARAGRFWSNNRPRGACAEAQHQTRRRRCHAGSRRGAAAPRAPRRACGRLP
jgi:hypothetical protein